MLAPAVAINIGHVEERHARLDGGAEYI